MLQVYGREAQHRHQIRDVSAIGEARRDAQRLAAQLSLDETLSGRIGVVVTELATNLLRHGGGGDLLLQALPAPTGTTVEVLAIDRGPGMPNVEQCLQDGYSSRGGTSGTGLGAVKRLSADFDIYSVSQRGTVLMARLGAPSPRFGAVCTAKDGETECGDAWRMASDEEDQTALIIIDGLGHGPSAAEAAHKAADSFTAQPFEAPGKQIERTHQTLHGTRGAAVACAAWDGTRALSYAGIGNISGRLWSAGGGQGLVSHNGTLGYQIRRMQQFNYPLPEHALLIMHTDGLSARWDLDDYAGLRYRHPAVIAATLHRDHTRGRDDATIVVAAA